MILARSHAAVVEYVPYTLPYTCQTGASTLAKVKKTFRIEEDAYDELVELSAGWGVAQGAAVERAIRLARQMPDTFIGEMSEMPDVLPYTVSSGSGCTINLLII